MKNEAANQPLPTSKSWMKPSKSQNAPFSIFVWRGGGTNFLSILYKHRRQPDRILNIAYLRLCDEIPAPENSVPRTLVKAKPR